MKYQKALKVSTIFYVYIRRSRQKVSEVKDKERQ